MPRTHSRTQTAIWKDGDFTAMRRSAQAMYLFLLSQDDLTHAGLLPLRVRRWATKAEDTSPKTIRDDLDYLAERDYIVVDEDTEEVLVRTFVRNDGVYKQPLVMERMREDAKQIESPMLRMTFAAELGRLPIHELNDEPAKNGGASVKQRVCDVLVALSEDFQEASREAMADPSERVTDTPHAGARTSTNHQPPTTGPHPPATVPPTAGRGEAGAQLALVTDAPTAQTLIAEWIDHCPDRPPGRVVGQVSKELKGLLDEGHDPTKVREALQRWNSKGLHPSTLPSVLHEVSNASPSVPRGQQATNDLFDRAMQRAMERDAR